MLKVDERRVLGAQHAQLGTRHLLKGGVDARQQRVQRRRALCLERRDRLLDLRARLVDHPLGGALLEAQEFGEVAAKQGEGLARNAHGDAELVREKGLVHAPQPFVDRRVAIGEHQHARRRVGGQHLEEGRGARRASEEGADVEVLRIRERADVGALAPVGPRGERVVDELVHALAPHVREEEVAAQPTARGVEHERVAHAGQLGVRLCERLEVLVRDLVHVGPDDWVVEALLRVGEAAGVAQDQSVRTRPATRHGVLHLRPEREQLLLAHAPVGGRQASGPKEELRPRATAAGALPAARLDECSGSLGSCWPGGRGLRCC